MVFVFEATKQGNRTNQPTTVRFKLYNFFDFKHQSHESLHLRRSKVQRVDEAAQGTQVFERTL
jgi:hypothetical protein